MNFYRADNAGQPIGGISFNVYDIVAGTACGVFATEDPEQIKTLDALVKTRRIESMTQEDYEKCSKKNRATLSAWKPLSVSTIPPKLHDVPALKGSGAVTVGKAEPAETPEPTVELNSQVESVDDALKLSGPSPEAKAESQPAAPAPQVDAPQKKKGK